MRVEPFEADKHYALVCGWWRAHKRAIVPLDMLSRNGVVALVNGKPSAAGWIYSTDSSVCWAEWLVVDPSLPRSVRDSAIESVLDAGMALARNLGFTRIYTLVSPRMRRYRKRIERRGLAAGNMVIFYARSLTNGD